MLCRHRRCTPRARCIRDPMKILRYKTVDSTNDIALRLVEEGAEDRTVVTANEQTAGRGRRGAEWVSPPGSNLYFSIILRPPTPFEPARVPELAFVVSVAIAQALRDLGVTVGIKWPNDVLARGKKISGILIELSPKRDAVVIGVGVNVNWREIPEELADRATSVALETGITVPVEDCLRLVLDKMEEALLLYEQGFEKTLKEWRSLECTTGREVKVMRDGEEVIGTASGIDERGGLLVKLASGEVVTVTAAGALIED